MEITLVKQTVERGGNFAHEIAVIATGSRSSTTPLFLYLNRTVATALRPRTHATLRSLTTIARGYIVMIGYVLCYRREVSIRSYDRRILWKRRLIPGTWPFLAFEDFMFGDFWAFLLTSIFHELKVCLICIF